MSSRFDYFAGHHLRPVSLIVLVAGSVSTVRGQDALRSALNTDSIVGQKSHLFSEARSDQPHLGPVQLALQAYSDVQLDDNVNTSENNPQSDTILRAGINLGLVWPATETSELSFSSKMGYATYLRHTRADTVEIAPDSGLAWNISFDSGGLTLYNQFSYSKQVITVGALSGLSELPRFENTCGVRAFWQPGQWQIETGYSHDDYLSDISAYQYLNRSSEYFFLRTGWRFAERTQAGVESSVSFTKYDLPIQSDNTSYSVGPYLDWQITRFIKATVHGGPTFYTFDNSQHGLHSTDLNSYYVDLNLSHELTDFFSHQLALWRNVSLGYGRGNNYTEQLSATYSAHWTVTRNLGLDLSLAYENGTQPLHGFSFPVQENFHRIGVSPGISIQLTEKLSGTLTGSHWTRVSNLAGNNYDENSIALEMCYQF